MNKTHLLFIAAILVFTGCGNEEEHKHGHGHEHGHSHSTVEPVSYTVYTEKTELFVEFKPLRKGKVSKFAAHFTTLGDKFNAVTEGSVSLKLIGKSDQPSFKSDAPSSPGIFRLSLKPINTGNYDLLFILKTKEYVDTIAIENISVYPNEKTAMKDVQENAVGDEISYLKEQAWKVEFANQPVVQQTFNEVIKTTGEIMPAQGDEIIITAKSSGIITYDANQKLIGSHVKKGEGLFSITGGGLSDNNIDNDYLESKANYEKALANYDRAKQLIKDKIISQKEYNSIEVEYKNAKVNYNNLANNYTSSGKKITAPIEGYLKNITVNEGEFVEVGQPIASISQNQKLILQAEVPQKYFSSLTNITSANFITPYDSKSYNSDSLNGKFISYGKNAKEYYIPVYFEIDNTGDIIPGSFVEIFLKAKAISNALVIPAEAILEEQGEYFTYVQTSGEGFQKRQLKLGAFDGFSYEVLSGVKEKERVVTKGAYQIKLATMSGKMPAHGHEH